MGSVRTLVLDRIFCCSLWLEKHRRCGRVQKEVHPRSPLRLPWVLSLFSCTTSTHDDVKFHRIIKGFKVQGGDPTGTGRGGESIYGKKFEDEIKPELKHTWAGAGILSMANAGPDTYGSQYFITLAPCASLDGKHIIFGSVCRGMEIIKRLGSVQTDNNDRLIHDVKVLRTTVKD